MAAPSTSSRGFWGSRLGFILAASGSAIGLGNIWRFPYSAGEGGGGVFVVIYLVFVVAIGLPVLLAELAVGRETRRNPVGAFKALVPGSAWPLVGGLGVLTGFGILAFYSVIAGWTVGYLWKALSGAFAVEMTAAQSEALFLDLIGSPVQAIALAAFFLIITVLVVRGGISGGIERVTTVLMPVLLVLLIVLAVRSVTLPGAYEGIEYLFKPDFSKINAGVVLNALGQALFSLSLGMGAMITYGSYFPDKENLASSGATVALFDTGIAMLAGIIIFPALFAAGVEPNTGPGLVFVVLPTIFEAMPFGTVFAISFYFLLAIAALTSTISLLEVVVSYFVDEKGWTRSRAAWSVGVICLLIATPSALSQGAVGWLSSGPWLGGTFLDAQNIIFGNYSLSIGAFMLCLFVGWKWGTGNALASLEKSGHAMPMKVVWSFLIRFLCPLAIVATLIYMIVTGNYL